MLDYHGIEALYEVLKAQSFEKAALNLHITQSAVSQRIKNLESFHGEPFFCALYLIGPQTWRPID